jgi:HK97 family phage prohead protease
MITAERRYSKRSPGATEAKGRTITGYAARFGVTTDISGQFLEVVKPGAFSRAIREKQDCRCLFNHNPDHILGRVANNTLSLSEDATGLKYRCNVALTRSGDDCLENLRVQNISGSSFGFVVPAGGDSWSVISDGNGRRRDLRELRDVDLYDVSPVTYPQYSDTSAGVDDDGDEADPLRNRLALAAFASSSCPAELRSRIAQVIAQAPLDPEEEKLLARARTFLSRLAMQQ